MDINEVARMIEAGLTVEAIAEELGCSTSSVYKIMRAVQPNRRKGRPSSGDVLTDVDRSEIVGEYRSGEIPVGEIVRSWKITYAVFYKTLRDGGVSLGRPKTPVKVAREEQAVQMYIDGAPLWEIVEETGVPQPVLHKMLHIRKVPFRHGSAPKFVVDGAPIEPEDELHEGEGAEPSLGEDGTFQGDPEPL